MTYSAIEVELRGQLAIIRLNAPNRLNAMSKGMVEEIESALDTIERDTRAMILTGAGRAFCSGADLTGGLKIDGQGASIDYGAVLESHINPMMTRLRNLSIPWITLVRGAAAGVGCSLALAADLIVAAENAYFLQAFARVGLIPDGGASFLLTRAVGRARASEMMLLGDRIPASQALDWGLVNRVVPDERLEEEGLALAQRLAEGPTCTLREIRRNCWKALDDEWKQAIVNEREAARRVSSTRDTPEGIAAFKEHRAPIFHGV
jgi:2-(1,2-epoxy-1,2-dihydrophenyl)acetyl-CoA isomerase